MHTLSHVDAMGDALAVSNDQRRTRMRFRFNEGLDRVRVVRAHRDLRDVDVAVSHRRHAKIFFDRWFSAGGELRHRAERRRLRSLTASVRINLGVEYENVNVLTAG